ncbi:MAG: DNRLRE domain-containing protein [Candidatus Margulisbacteria bacterium]|nr:DNRLRE domain-containing protein [Candidatus Margulisiibacteriota bacterium]MBU1021141.1 DNRLRE domain-containing protein [Candidatus Margulisiibacteriota bacterium]MBU1729747.1 DNRLRE domain-containing protein [Candidatus Margulisiibacteriota bacterium]MBU1955248.1 DNRLRE domain-containing protein [Candidatus Margulisiibacteriota bacterium]
MRPTHNILIFAVLLVLVFMIAIWGCGQTGGGGTGSITSIIVIPYAAYVSPEATQQFLCYGYSGSTNVGTVSATWSFDGTVGFIDSDGLFTASTEGTGTVEAAYSSFSANSSVTVSTTYESGQLYQIEVSPTSATVRVGAIQAFTATGTDIDGNTVSMIPVWSVSNTTVGGIDSDGTFYASVEGGALIRCTSGEVVGTATVSVEGVSVSITAEADTYVDSSNSTTNYGSETSMTASYDNTTTTERYVYVQFPLGSIPAGASIESVTINLYVTSTDGSDYEIYLVSTSWTEGTVTWNTKPTQGNYITTGSFSSGQYNSIAGGNLPTIVQGWLDGTTGNNGILIRKGTGAEGNVTFLTHDNADDKPMLEIDYTTP